MRCTRWGGGDVLSRKKGQDWTVLGKMASEEQVTGREASAGFGQGNSLSRPQFLGSGR